MGSRKQNAGLPGKNYGGLTANAPLQIGPLSDQCYVVRVACTGPMWLAFDSVAAPAVSMLVTGDSPETFAVRPGMQLSVLQVNGPESFTITEMD